MGYSKLKNIGSKKITLDIKILGILKARKDKFDISEVNTYGFGSYLLQKILSNNKQKTYYQDLIAELEDLINKGLVGYDEENFYSITDKGKRYLDTSLGEKGKKLNQIIKKLY